MGRITELVTTLDDSYDVEYSAYCTMTNMGRITELVTTLDDSYNVDCRAYLTNRFHVAVRLFSNRSQMT